MFYDLHIHTQASDGTLSPEQVIDTASSFGVPGIAITDHDSIAGLKPAFEYLEANRHLTIELVPGIELNTDWGKSEIHILGYFIDYENHFFQTRLKELKEARLERAVKMTKKLRRLGIEVHLEEVSRVAQGELIGRPHIAQILIDKKYVKTMREAFAKYIGPDGPAFVPRYKFRPSEAIELIKKVHGIPVLAHPGLIREAEKVKVVLDQAAAGLEVYYPEHRPEQMRTFFSFCRQNHLLITGGTDFHGFGAESRCNKIGQFGLNKELFVELKQYYHQINR